MRLLPLAFRLTVPFGVLLLALPSWAQDGERLPDLTPTSFEITGDVEINLPQLERQPLSGFGPPPRTYVVPAERRSVSRAYGPSLAGLPTLRLAPPPDPVSLLVAGRSVRVEGGFGTEVARYGRVDVATGGRGGTFFLQGDYDGISPTVEVGAPASEDYVEYERFGARAGYQTGGAVRAGLELGAVQDRFSLPPAIAPTTERTVSSFDAIGSLKADATTSVPASLRLRFARTEATYDAAPGNPTVLSDPETRFEATGTAEFARQLIRVEGGVGTSQFIDASGETDLMDYNGGLLLQANRGSGPQFVIGVRALGYTTSLLNGNAETTTFAPVGHVVLPLGETVTVFARSEPTLERRDLLGFLSTNPYAFPAFLAPDVHSVDAQAGFSIRRGALGLTLYGGAQISPTRLFFTQEGGTSLYEPSYERARTVQAGADLTVATPSGVEFSAGFAVRDGELTDFSESLPFYASTVGRAALVIPFAEGRGRLGMSLYAEGTRPVDRTGLVEAPSWASLSAEGSYELGAGFGVVLRGDRLAGSQEQWPGYPQAPFVVMGGVRFVR